VETQWPLVPLRRLLIRLCQPQHQILPPVRSRNLQQHVRPAELARRLKTTPQEVNRLTNVQHTSRIDGIAAALKALGKRLDMRTV
jgi:hypothetical protein